MRERKHKNSTETSAEDWHPEDIKAAVRKTGISMDELSRQEGFSRGSLRVTLVRPWPRGQEAIAKRLGLPPQSIWPSRYDPVTGEPLTGFYSTGVLRSRPDLAAQRPKSQVA